MEFQNACSDDDGDYMPSGDNSDSEGEDVEEAVEEDEEDVEEVVENETRYF